MIGRILALLGGVALGALALLLFDPAVYGPEAPQISMGAYETFRPLATFCMAGLALCGLMGAFQPPARRERAKAEPSVEFAQDEGFTPAETAAEAESDPFQIRPAPAASPLW